MSNLPSGFLTPQEYLARERLAEFRSEYLFAASGLYTYPDFSVICGALEFDDEIRDTVLNPTLLVERFTRNPDDTWTPTVVSGLDQTLALPSIGVTLALAEVFDRVEFPPAAAQPATT